jgi:hypothetical protein
MFPLSSKMSGTFPYWSNGKVFFSLKKNNLYMSAIDINERFTDYWHVPPALFVWLVLLVAAAKMPVEKAALVPGHITKLEQSTFL